MFLPIIVYFRAIFQANTINYFINTNPLLDPEVFCYSLPSAASKALGKVGTV